MKKVFTFAVASLVTLLSFAADNPPRDGRLRVSNFSRQDIVVVVDGRLIRDRDDHVLIGGLRPGYHEVKVYRQDHRGRRRANSIFGLGGRLIYNSSVFVTPGSETRVIVDRGGSVYVDRQRGRGGRGGRGGRDRDYDYGYGRDRDGDYGRDRRDRDWRK